MDFNKFLDENDMPHVGEVVITPKGDRVEVVAYIFDNFDDYVKARLLTAFDAVVEWQFSQLKLCKREEN